MPTQSANLTLDADVARRTYCPSCKSDHTVSYRNGDGQWYCRCLNCACRFWAA
jgi:formate dehydrogenase maturation protein FdhE